MFDIKLDKDEKILKYACSVKRIVGTVTDEVENMYLSNKNIIFVYKITTNFSTTVTKIKKTSLYEIGKYNKVPQVFRTKIQGERWSLKIMYKNGINELLIFQSNNEILDWENAITDAIKKLPEINTDKIHSRLCPNCHAPLNAYQTVCSYCGSEVKLEREYREIDKFIEGLEKIRTRRMQDTFSKTNSTNVPAVDSKIENELNEDTKEKSYAMKEIKKSTRKMFKGVPSGGSIVTSLVTSVVGTALDKAYEYNRRDKINQVEIAKIRSEEAERIKEREERMKKELRFEEQTEKLIREYIINYPIPPMKEDIFDFLQVTVSNITSKKEDYRSINEIDAWYSKLESIYSQAKLWIDNPDDMTKIQAIYDENRKKENRKEENIKENIKEKADKDTSKNSSAKNKDKNETEKKEENQLIKAKGKNKTIIHTTKEYAKKAGIFIKDKYSKLINKIKK